MKAKGFGTPPQHRKPSQTTILRGVTPRKFSGLFVKTTADTGAEAEVYAIPRDGGPMVLIARSDTTRGAMELACGLTKAVNGGVR